MDQALTGWGRALIAARWLRDQFAGLFASFWLYIILWSVVLGAFSVLLYIDGVFSRALAPESIEPLSFQAMGWVYRLFAASFLMAAARCRLKGLKGVVTYRVLGAFASVVVCLHAFGFGFEALDDRRDQALAVREVETARVDASADVIARYERQKDDIRADLGIAVAALDAEIRQYITDGLNNDDLADDARERRQSLQDAAQAKIDAIDTQLISIVSLGAGDRIEAAKQTSQTEPWAPLFVGLAQLFTWSKEPSDWEIYLAAIGFVILWVLLGEALVIFLPERIYVMHLHDAEQARRSAASRKGWERRNEKAKSEPLQISDGNYWEDLVARMVGAKRNNPKYSVIGLAHTFMKTTAPDMSAQLREQVRRGRVSQADYDFLMDIPAISKPNGKDEEGEHADQP